MSLGGGGGKPIMLLIAGGNGAGKSSMWEDLKVADSSYAFLEYLNVDDKIRELRETSPDAPFSDATHWRNARVKENLSAKRSFAAETVLDAGKVGYIKQAKKAGFNTSVFFVGLSDPDLAVERVRIRVHLNGHDVPEATVRQKWRDALDVADSAIKHADSMSFFDNSGDGAQTLVARFLQGRLDWISDSPPDWLFLVGSVAAAFPGRDGHDGTGGSGPSGGAGAMRPADPGASSGKDEGASMKGKLSTARGGFSERLAKFRDSFRMPGSGSKPSPV